MTPYENSHVRQLEKLAKQADALAAQAAKWLDELAAAEIDESAAEASFLADFKPANARALIEARAKVRDLGAIAASVEDAGGPDEARARYLRAPEVFEAFERGFAERVIALEALGKVARRELGARYAELTEEGVSPVMTAYDQTARAWRDHGTAITNQLADAKFAAAYAAKRGAKHEPRSFDSLRGVLVSPLPTPPAIPSTKESS